jgi:hypothetical protein
MAWTAPRTWVTGEIVTAALLNTHLRDNLVDLDRRTSPSEGYVGTIETTTSTTYTDLATAGPAVTQTIGSTGKALVALYAAMSNAGGNFALMSYAITGATTAAAGDQYALQTNNASDIRFGATVLQTGLNAGSTTFTAKYRATATTAGFNGRRILVSPLGS